jgi:hydroxypyruvate isomerase
MLRFAANLSMMYTELPFLERFDAAAKDGFDAVEFLFPYEHEPQEIASRLTANRLTQALFNLPPGDFARGERGQAALPGREDEFAAGVERALPYALATGCRRLHAMAGIAAPDADRCAMRVAYVSNLRLAARRLAPHGIDVLIEPINARDIPGYFLNHQQAAHDIAAEVGEPNLKVQMDLYHCQVVEGDLVRRMERYIGGVGHFQIAGVPERHEPDTGEVNYAYVFERLEALGWDGFVGCEYRPRGGTSAGLGWLRRYRDAHARQ